MARIPATLSNTGAAAAEAILSSPAAARTWRKEQEAEGGVEATRGKAKVRCLVKLVKKKLTIRS
jgi:hypothetical protein